MYDETYEQQVVWHIHNLEDRIRELEVENTRLFRENKSYKAWMDRSINMIRTWAQK